MNRIVIRRLPKVRKMSFIKNLLFEYCSTTSLHGITHMKGENKTLIERACWLVVFICSFCMCSYLIARTWSKWQNDPVILSFSSRQNSICDIPFPAVTICPLNKVQQTVYNYTDIYSYRHLLTGKDKKRFWDISLICNHLFKIDYNSSLTTDEEAIKSLLLVAPSLNITFLNTQQNNVIISPEILFADHITEEGLCFTYNAFSHNDMYTDEVDSTFQLIKHNRSNEGWSLENGYAENAGLKTYPRRPIQDGLKAGLGLVLYNNHKDTDYCCGNVKGFKVLLHNPAETPRLKHKFIYVPLGKAVAIAINVKMLTSSEGLKYIPIKSRNCYFSQERTLRFYKTYTQENCKKECLANITRIYCQCLPFHYPRDNKTPICGYGKYVCSNEVDLLMFAFSALLMNNTQFDNPIYEAYKECKCLPACTSLDYETESSLADFVLVEKILVTKEYTPENQPNSEGVNFTRVSLYFKNSEFLSLHRQELFGRTDFLANCGGLLGLFLGFSIVSLIEIVYFVTLRLWCSVRQYQNLKEYRLTY